ncbi:MULTISPECIES: hypothetical protein [Bacteria]|uniref:hypothetical protein n=1 Tax=Bacteria TaxID=2 RepID=UPI0024183588|nr:MULTISPECIES: hypothetical protein [Bacteria]EEV6119369.1 hypothetical protein [Escherichia coli]WFQ01438.1 hypothetical protein P9N54_06540 [Escherichia coli O155:H21]WGI56106.1 hypothetical protein QEN27_08760 [Escherichia coli]WGI60565.1 hypothetical protein QEN28_08750 [Escherichia coli O155]WGI65054.1 hypothetical protein QEN29_07820 [Escherichia coli]
MFLLLVLPILVSGFIFCQIHPVLKNTLYRYEGQFLYLKSAQYGVFFLFMGFFLAELIDNIIYYPTSICNLSFSRFSIIGALDALLVNSGMENSADSKKLANLILIFIFTILSPYLWNRVEIFRLKKKYSTENFTPYIMSNILRDSPLDDLLFKSSIKKGNIEDISIMLTLSDRKVYVGKVVSLGEPNETEGPDQEIELIPVVSGYRNKDTLTVTFTTHYSKLAEDIKLVIKQSEIISATPFSFPNYDKFKEDRKKENVLISFLKNIFH